VQNPGVIAQATAADSGGTVACLLLPNRKQQTYTATLPYFANDTVSGSILGWDATINGAPSGTTVNYTMGTGNESAAEFDTGTIMKWVLRNTTRGNDALVDTINTTTNVITLVDTVPGDWASGDVITIESDISASTFAMRAANTATIPENATHVIVGYRIASVSGATGKFITVSPHLPKTDSVNLAILTQVAGISHLIPQITVALYERTTDLLWQDGGTNTVTINLQLRGWIEATP
jgi:hypothetical protein